MVANGLRQAPVAYLPKLIIGPLSFLSVWGRRRSLAAWFSGVEFGEQSVMKKGKVEGAAESWSGKQDRESLGQTKPTN